MKGETLEDEPTGSSTGGSKGRPLQLLFEVEPDEECSCPLSDPDSAVEDVHNYIDGDVCHAELTAVDEDDASKVVQTTNEVQQSCLCLAFSEVGCVPRFKRADGTSILVETYVSDRDEITELVDRMKSATGNVSLRRLTSRRPTDANPSEPTTLDLSSLTTKQREAATMAVSEGYYQSPRQTDLEELAEALDISKSALSQRLSAVESKLAMAAFDP